MLSVRSARAALPRLLLLLLCTDGFVVSAQPAATKEDIQQLRKLLAAQQEQIRIDLRRLLNEQSKLQGTHVELCRAAPNLPNMCPKRQDLPSRPSRSLARARHPPRQSSGQQPEAGRSAVAAHLGAITVAPTGFIDYSQVWRSKTVTSGLPTNFAAIPFTRHGGGTQETDTVKRCQLTHRHAAQCDGFQSENPGCR